jgi:hypothetical protein
MRSELMVGLWRGGAALAAASAIGLTGCAGVSASDPSARSTVATGSDPALDVVIRAEKLDAVVNMDVRRYKYGHVNVDVLHGARDLGSGLCLAALLSLELREAEAAYTVEYRQDVDVLAQHPCAQARPGEFVFALNVRHDQLAAMYSTVFGAVADFRRSGRPGVVVVEGEFLKTKLDCIAPQRLSLISGARDGSSTFVFDCDPARTLVIGVTISADSGRIRIYQETGGPE